MKILILALILCCFLSFALPSLAAECGAQAGGKLCPGGLCCGQWGYCGCTDAYCKEGCQSNCKVQLILSDVGELISKQAFERMMLLHCNGRRPNTGVGFDTYEAFITAAKSFPSFSNTGTIETRKRELVTFLAQTLRGIAGNNWPTENEAVSYVVTAIRFWMTPQSSKFKTFPPSSHDQPMELDII